MADGSWGWRLEKAVRERGAECGPLGEAGPERS